MNPTPEQTAILDHCRGTRSVEFYSQLKLQPNGCLEFMGRRLEKGYGYFKGALAHRFVWEQEKGPIPKGLWVLHKCDNPPCCDTKHLFLGTCQDNTDDKMHKGRNPSRIGINNGRALLTEEEVREIHMLFLQGMTSPQIAVRYIVTADTLRAIKSGFSWKHIYTEFYDAAN